MEIDYKKCSNIFGYIYLTLDMNSNKKYVGQSRRILKNNILNYKGSGTIISRKIKKHNTKFFKKFILDIAYTQKEL